MTAVLIHVDPEWPMPGFGGTVSPRRLRVWRTDTGAVWVVITERGAGTSITNVADVVVPLIRARYASARVVEHYPPEPGSPEHFDEIVATAECLRWHRIRVEEIVALLGEQVLDDVPVLPPDPQPSRAVPATVTVAGPGLPDDAVIRGYPGGLVVVADSAGAELGPLTHFFRHSPTGFGWGYGGSGPAELARCILLAVLGDAGRCGQCGGQGQVVPSDDWAGERPYRPETDDEDLVMRCLACDAGSWVTPSLYQRFKRDHVARWRSAENWTACVGDVRVWFAAEPVDTCRAPGAKEPPR